MIILANTANDKGKQLEVLAQRLLRNRGYENCTTNVMANGAEIDVRGQLDLRSLGQGRSQTLVCECKAHKAVMDMTQWCKFLGKVYHQEICEHAEVAGCFISLSGVNGHVQGNFDELCRHKKSITLLHGDDLMEHVGEIIPFVSLGVINRQVNSMTYRTASRFEPAYHDGAIYWIVVFSGGDFTIFTADGLPLEPDIATRLAGMVKDELDVSSFINIQKETQAIERARKAEVLVVATLFDCGGSVERIDGFEQIDDFSPQELQDAAQRLVQKEHLVMDGEVRCSVPVLSSYLVPEKHHSI